MAKRRQTARKKNEPAAQAIAGALPVGQNSPQKVPFGLYAEQLSGSSFTMARPDNLRSWLYRLRPSAAHGPFERIDDGLVRTGRCREVETSPNRLRWAPQPMPADRADFVAGLSTYATCGEARAQHGAGVHVYCANRSMDRVFYDADGEMLFVPQEGAITLATDTALLKKWAPYYVFHPDEVNMPSSIEWYLARTALWDANGKPSAHPVGHRLGSIAWAKG